MNLLLWILQTLLALLFLFAGSMKFIIPVTEMNRQAPLVLPGWFLHFIAVCEILGAIGLILPSLLRIKAWLTPLAAWGLVIITLGATIITTRAGISKAWFPFVVCLLSLLVAYGRWRVAPISPR